MEEKKMTTVDMTEEEKKQFEAFRAEQAKKEALRRRKENREAYAALVDEQVDMAIEALTDLSEQIAAVKRTVFSNFIEILKMKDEVMGLTNKSGQASHTFTNSDSSARIQLGVRTVDAYRDTCEDGIAMVKEYIESLAKDENSKALVNAVIRLLAKDQRGTLKASRVLQLRKMADETGDERFQEGVRIIEESYQPMATKQFISAERRGDNGEWVTIPLSVTEA
jgi:hypothetical protein